MANPELKFPRLSTVAVCVTPLSVIETVSPAGTRLPAARWPERVVVAVPKVMEGELRLLKTGVAWATLTTTVVPATP